MTFMRTFQLFAQPRTTLSRMSSVLFVVCVMVSVCAVHSPANGANVAPDFSITSNKYIAEGDALALSVHATDANSDPLTIALVARPAGAVFTDLGSGNGAVNWTPEFLGSLSSVGSPFRFDFVASDGVKHSQMTVFVFVADVNRAPKISAPDSVVIEYGDPVSFSISAMDPDFDPLTWSVIHLPDEAQISSNSPRAFHWTPSIVDTGLATVTVAVSDNKGLADTITSLVRVLAGAPQKLVVALDTAYPGEIRALQIRLDNQMPLSAFNLLIHYDPGVMSVLSVTPAGSRAASFEYFSATVNSSQFFPGEIRIIGVADQPGGATTPPLAAGNGTLFVINSIISSSSALAGLYLPVTFISHDQPGGVDNTLKNELGEVVAASDISFEDGGFMVRDQSQIGVGDINLNGVPYEVGDVIRFTNYFINPYANSFSPAQFANSDVNGDNIVASVADLVAMISVIIGGAGKAAPGGLSTAQVDIHTADEQSILTLSTDGPVSAIRIVGRVANHALMTHNGVTPSASLVSGDMIVSSHVENGVVRILIYSMAGATISASDKVTLANITGLGAGVVLDSVEIVSPNGSSIAYAVGANVTPEYFTLEQNYPNPFNPTTQLAFAVPKTEHITLMVYDIMGRVVRTLVDGEMSAGEHRLEWDGHDSAGRMAPSGVYFYKLVAGENSAVRKMTLVK